MTEREAKRRAYVDFETALWSHIRTDHLMGFVGDDFKEWYFDTEEDGPLVQVVRTDECDVMRFISNWLDPSWDVILLEAHPDIPDDARSLWIYGPSYETGPTS